MSEQNMQNCGELLPCPFCGGATVTLIIREDADDETEYYTLTCSPAYRGCGAQTADFDSIDAAKVAWNRRSPSLAEADARRYRWLREHPKGQFTDAEEKEWWPSVWLKGASRPLQAGFLDQMVDEAIALDERAALNENLAVVSAALSPAGKDSDKGDQ